MTQRQAYRTALTVLRNKYNRSNVRQFIPWADLRSSFRKVFSQVGSDRLGSATRTQVEHSTGWWFNLGPAFQCAMFPVLVAAERCSEF